MALIICPECGSQISEYTNSCPKCGAPIARTGTSVAMDEEIFPVSSDSNVSGKKALQKRAPVLIVVTALVFVAVGITIFILKGQNNIVGTWEYYDDGLTLFMKFTDDGEYQWYGILEGYDDVYVRSTGTFSIDGDILYTSSANSDDWLASNYEGKYEVQGDKLILDGMTLDRIPWENVTSLISQRAQMN